MNESWNYVPFDSLFDWCTKSNIGSRQAVENGKYTLYIASATEKKRYNEYLYDGEALVFGTGGNPAIHYATNKFAYTNHTEAAIAKDNSVNLKFYYYYFQLNKYEQLRRTFVGGGIKNSSKKKIGALLVPVVDIETQKCIVAKIEELFSELDNNIETLKNTKQQLAVYRQAVLKEAFKDCYRKVTVESVCQHVTDGDHMPPPKTKQGFPFIMISNIENHIINWNNTAYVGDEYYNNIDIKRKPCKGDVLYTVTGSYGIPILIDFEKSFCFQRHIALLRPNSSINQKFLYYVMQTPEVYIQATKGATGIAQKTVGLGVLRKIQIPYCDDITIQSKIVDDIETKMTICSNIEKIVDTALQQSEAMRQSILKKAFEGNEFNDSI